MTAQQRVRGGAERLAYASLMNTIAIKNLLPGRNPLVPAFLLIGAQRSGTTSLLKYLSEHPNFIPPVRKEVHFFDTNFDRRVGWYAAHFPNSRPDAFTGDATPYYLFHPKAAKRAALTLPNAKILVLLRDPVSRARSHYQHEVAKGIETMPFSEALKLESKRLSGRDVRQSPRHNAAFAHQHFSYVARGRYMDQILAWQGFYDRKKIHVVISEELFSSPQSSVNGITDFLEVDRFQLKSAKAYNSYPKAPVEDKVLDGLAQIFENDNARLADYLGRPLPWRSPGG